MTPFLWFLVICLVGGVGIWASFHERSYEKLFREELERRGLTFIAQETPHVGDIGPFSRDRRKYNHRARATEKYIWSTHRIVRYADRNNVEREVWVKIRYVVYSRKAVIWKPRLPNPPSDFQN